MNFLAIIGFMIILFLLSAGYTIKKYNQRK